MLAVDNNLTKTNMNMSKAQFYGGDGTGRDTYIYMNNGGFCPEKQPCKVEEIGRYPLISKHRHIHPWFQYHDGFSFSYNLGISNFNGRISEKSN